MLNRVSSVRVLTCVVIAGVLGWGVVLAIRAADSSPIQPEARTIALAAPGEKGPGKNADKGPKGGPPKKEAVTIEQVPVAARASIQKAAADAVLTKLEKETKGTEEAYKAEWGQKGQMQELKVTPDGAVLELKKDIAVAELPEVVAAAAKKELGDLKDAECKKIQATKKGQAQERYEVRVDAGGQKKHIAITPDGTVEVKGPKGPKAKPGKAEQPKA